MIRGRRLLLLVLIFCLSLAAVVPYASASGCLFRCSTNGQTTLMPIGCCTFADGPMFRYREYVCQNGCFQATDITMCSVDPCE